MGILKFLFRKKTLQSIFYIIIVAIIREATAIGADEGYENLVNAVIEIYNNDSVIIGGLLLLLIYTKGSFFTLGILFVLLWIVRDLLKVEITSRKITFPYLDLYIDNTFSRPQQYNRGISSKGYGKTFSPGDAPYKFIWKWLFKFRIVNVSDYNAYNVVYDVEKGKNLFDYIEPIPKPLSITGNQSIEFEAYSEISKEVSGKEGGKYRESPLPADKDFDNVKILITYQNTDRIKFYTLYSVQDGIVKNDYFRYKPEPFAKYSWFQRIRIHLNQ